MFAFRACENEEAPGRLGAFYLTSRWSECILPRFLMLTRGLTKLWLTIMQVFLFSAVFVLFLSSVVAIFLSLRAILRVANFQKSLKDLDWEAVAKLTGDIGSVKRSVQTLNNRINGMENSKGNARDALAQVQAAQMRQVTPFGGGG